MGISFTKSLYHGNSDGEVSTFYQMFQQPLCCQSDYVLTGIVWTNCGSCLLMLCKSVGAQINRHDIDDSLHISLQYECRGVSNHRPHSRQVTGARCTEVAARQSWAEYSSRPTTDSRHQGWAIKDFFVLSEMLTIYEQPFYGIVLMILHTNKSCVLIRDQNSQIFLKSI